MRAVDLAVAVGGVDLLGDAVGFEHAGQLAAAVEPEVESVQRADAAAVEHLAPRGGGDRPRSIPAGPSATFASSQSGRASTRQVVPNSVETASSSSVAPKAGVGEPDRPAVLPGQDQAGVVEVKLGEDVLFEQIGRDRAGPSPGWPARLRQMAVRTGGSVLRNGRYVNIRCSRNRKAGTDTFSGLKARSMAASSPEAR